MHGSKYGEIITTNRMVKSSSFLFLSTFLVTESCGFFVVVTADTNFVIMVVIVVERIG